MQVPIIFVSYLQLYLESKKRKFLTCNFIHFRTNFARILLLTPAILWAARKWKPRNSTFMFFGMKDHLQYKIISSEPLITKLFLLHIRIIINQIERKSLSSNRFFQSQGGSRGIGPFVYNAKRYESDCCLVLPGQPML